MHTTLTEKKYIKADHLLPLKNVMSTPVPPKKTNAIHGGEGGGS